MVVSLITSVLIGTMVILKLYQKLTLRMYTGDVKMKDKVVIVTGSNTGIGYVTAKDLARREAKVILACRDPRKGIAARDKIIQSTGNQNVIYKQLDLTSFKSVRYFADDILRTETKLDVLINNAGTANLDNSLTDDNLPIEAQVNHFSPFLLTMLLLPLLKSSAPSRIVNVASLMHKVGTVEWLDQLAKTGWQHSRVYSNTKLANVIFTKKLSEQLKGTGVTVNSLHPGAVYTDILRHQYFLTKLFLRLLFLTPLEGSQTSIYVAVAPELESVSGKYFSNCSEATPWAKDNETADKLWEMSERVTFREKKAIE